MTRILVNLTALNFTVLAATFVVGWVSFFRGSRAGDADDPTYMLHMFLGLTATTTTLFLHSLVFIYFLGTGRWVKEVAIAYAIPDQPLPKLTRDLKRRAFPAALFAMLVPIAASAAGGGAATMGWPWPWHASLAVVTLAVNVWAFAVEYRCVRTNAGVIDDVMREVERIRAERGLPSNAEALEQEQG